MKKIYNYTFLVALLLSTVGQLSAQNELRSVIQNYLTENAEDLGVSAQDVSSWDITDNVFNERNGIRHVHIVQTRNNVPLKNGVANVTINTKNEVLYVGNRLIANIDAMTLSSQPKISATSAINSAAKHVKMQGKWGQEIENKENGFVFEKGTLAKEDIAVSLAYWKTNEGISLVWVVSLYQLDGEHWWQVFVDADSKEVIEKLDWVVSCELGHAHVKGFKRHTDAELNAFPQPAFKTSGVGIGQYNVFPLPVESPIHGSRALVVSPADGLGSPFGWHDINGVEGPEYTITRGNNAFAYTDVTDNNTPDFFPNGGASMTFNFPLDLTQAPTVYQPAAVTNLFYANNRIHDIFYRYGFNEANGNFQENNYGNGGLGSDYVNAEAQDGGGTNNANFATPGDGQNPRMQMYLWGGGAGSSVSNLLTINTPTGLSGPYSALQSNFGGALTTTPITANLVIVSDGSLDSTEGCSALVNGSAISGNIAVVRRGNCAFVNKVINAQTAGAIAVIIVNNAGGIISPGGANPLITIPSIMVSLQDGNTLMNSINSGTTVNGTLQADTTGGFSSTKDGDFDNGIVIHEYGHGISNRIAGGPLNSNCLSNAEQMGEGWSDFFAVMLTMDTNLTNLVRRPIGTFATGASPSGIGIRNAPYDTSFAVNSFTYGDVNNTGAVSQPHGVGFVWATMLWDLNWALINQYGFDANIDSGNGGNNMALQLVVDGLGLQPCSPGFVDGRDAILLADQINNNGANKCLIWKVFARRGLGFSASQGSSASRSDQVEAFDIPTFCQTPVKSPVADFSSDVTSTCQGVVNFTDQSIDVPQSWLWNFGDGTTDSLQNPTHNYTAAGTYNVSLAVYNTLGGDTLTKTSLISITFPNPPTAVTNGSGCSSDSIVLTATGSGTIGWFDSNDNFLRTGNTIKTAPSLSSTTYYARNGTVFPKNNVGPQNGSVGTGNYHGGNFTGTVNFDAQKALTIHSAWVDAGSAGTRTITLWDAYSGNGNVVQTITVNIPAGQGRIDLGFEVPAAGQYSIGLDQADLYRNSAGANYPYDIAGLISLTSSSAQSGGSYYYYFYDLEVSEAACWSDSVAVVATISDTADFNFSGNNLTFNFTDLTPNATSWAWNFGDGNTSSLQNPTHTYATTGVYNVTLNVNGGACIVSYQIGVGVSIGLEEDASDAFGIKLFPNPANEELNIAFSKPLGYATKARIYALNGKLIKEISIASTDESILIPLDGVISNLYVLEIDLEDGKYHQKITVMK